MADVRILSRVHRTVLSRESSLRPLPSYMTFAQKATLWGQGTFATTPAGRSAENDEPCPRYLAHMLLTPKAPHCRSHRAPHRPRCSAPNQPPRASRGPPRTRDPGCPAPFCKWPPPCATLPNGNLWPRLWSKQRVSHPPAPCSPQAEGPGRRAEHKKGCKAEKKTPEATGRWTPRGERKRAEPLLDVPEATGRAAVGAGDSCGGAQREEDHRDDPVGMRGMVAEEEEEEEGEKEVGAGMEQTMETRSLTSERESLLESDDDLSGRVTPLSGLCSSLESSPGAGSFSGRSSLFSGVPSARDKCWRLLDDFPDEVVVVVNRCDVQVQGAQDVSALTSRSSSNWIECGSGPLSRRRCGEADAVGCPYPVLPPISPRVGSAFACVSDTVGDKAVERACKEEGDSETPPDPAALSQEAGDTAGKLPADCQGSPEKTKRAEGPRVGETTSSRQEGWGILLDLLPSGDAMDFWLARADESWGETGQREDDDDDGEVVVEEEEGERMPARKERHNEEVDARDGVKTTTTTTPDMCHSSPPATLVRAASCDERGDVQACDVPCHSTRRPCRAATFRSHGTGDVTSNASLVPAAEASSSGEGLSPGGEKACAREAVPEERERHGSGERDGVVMEEGPERGREESREARERRLERAEGVARAQALLQRLRDAERPAVASIRGGGGGSGSPNLSNFDDFDFLAKYCIFNQQALGEYQLAFSAVDEDEDGYLSGAEVCVALKAVLPPGSLSDAEEMYVYRVLEIVDYRVADGLTDFRLFAVIASLARRIAALDDFMRNLINHMDFKALEMRMSKARALFECNVEAHTRRIQPGQLALELRAGGVSPRHERAVRGYGGGGGHQDRSLDLLDFLSFLPLFVHIHGSVLARPLASP
ncbi:uncharacterized protein LOC133347533 isoform X3 [Lethenteron reissneri]|uniref:uncharacterized protein LOC133347533 isoform X3 n=1 Tax=Lethenteron reissneri TaxID=7753 RepID=UPI002AB66A06|nr:uncharacterized protein LOC133347533 isoform X3 [Lethenteron reissneri]